MDQKAAKLKDKVTDRLGLVPGEDLLVAVPVRRRPTTGALAGIARRVREDLGHAHEHLLCVTTQRLVIVRNAAFGLGGVGAPIEKAAVARLETHERDVLVVFVDGTELAFQVGRRFDSSLLAAAGDAIWG